jgi:hypothetical protein
MRNQLWWVSCVALAVVGCGGPANNPPTVADMEETKLNDVGELYRVYQTSKNKAPTKIADLTAFEQMSPMGVQAIRTGEVIVRLGATLPDTGEGPGTGPADEVLAYQKQVPASGGQVLMLNRTIKSMSAEEFKAAKLAGNASSADEASKTKGKTAAKPRS